MATVREQALAPLSRAEAERLLPTLSVGRQTLERRILRARCLTYVESFDDLTNAHRSCLASEKVEDQHAGRVAERTEP